MRKLDSSATSTMLVPMEKRWNTAIIVAAGSGSRFGTDMPKQFLMLQDREVLSYSVGTFWNHSRIHEVIIVVAAEFVARVSLNYPECIVVSGGATRQDSVAKGLAACSPQTELVLVHDAARPLLPDQIIDTCLEAMVEYDAVAPAVTPVDSMVLLEKGGFSNLKRSDLRIVQTPQCLRLPILKSALDSGFVDTDEIGLVKQALPEARVNLIPGAQETFKITHLRDLDLALHYLQEKANL